MWKSRVDDDLIGQDRTGEDRTGQDRTGEATTKEWKIIACVVCLVYAVYVLAQEQGFRAGRCG